MPAFLLSIILAASSVGSMSVQSAEIRFLCATAMQAALGETPPEVSASIWPLCHHWSVRTSI